MTIPDGIKLMRNQDNAVVAIEVNTSGTEVEAHGVANGRLKRFLALLSLYHNQQINAKYQGWRRIRPDGKEEILIELVASLSSSVSISASGKPSVDLTKSFSSTDPKFWRQVAHFQKGAVSTNPVERYREFYQVLEDEPAQINLMEKALRHAVNHPLLSKSKFSNEVSRMFGVPYFDPLNDGHVKIIGAQAEELGRRALEILLAKSV
jgi:hypothetical protein